MQDSTALAEQNFVSLFDLANRLHEQAEFMAAAAAFRQCLDLAPGRPEILFNLGNALLAAGKPREAAEHLFRCTQLAPAFAGAYVNLAHCLMELAEPAAARTVAEIALRLAPDAPAAQRCLAVALHHAGHFEAAAAAYRRTLAAEPDDHATLTNLGNVLHCLGDLPGALAAHDRALDLCPGNAQIQLNRATVLLAMGNFGEGWEEYEARWLLPSQSPRQDFGPAWQGEPLGGRTILLRAEQGFGDTLQFARYAPVVASRGGRVVLQVQPELAQLMGSLRGVAAVVGRGEPLPHFDTHCPLMSLPRVCGTALDTIPAETPYLSADPGRVAFWDKRLPRRGKLRVGLVWAGRPAASWSRGAVPDRRSMSLAHLSPLANVRDIQFISLQKPSDEDLASILPDAFDPMAEVGTFAETAAIVSNLDLVVSVDTSTAHLAGALGRPVWMLSRFDGCWRWLAGRDDSPWYPTMRIIRQPRPHDWESVVARVGSELADVAAGKTRV